MLNYFFDIYSFINVIGVTVNQICAVDVATDVDITVLCSSESKSFLCKINKCLHN